MSAPEIVAAHLVIANEIAQGCNQRSVARTYSLALLSSDPFDAAAANRAILARWSPAGLRAIKEAAWSVMWRGEPLWGEE